MSEQHLHSAYLPLAATRGPETPAASLLDTRTRLERARRFIDDNYFQPLDLDQVAREACFSRFHFVRLFRIMFGITPHQYLMRRRVEKAKEMLIMQKYNVTEVCFEVGFESLGSFSTLFKRISGVPPIAYRAGLFRPVPKSLIWPKALVPYCLISRVLAPPQNRNIREAAPGFVAYAATQPNQGEMS